MTNLIESTLYQKIREVIPTVCVDLLVTNQQGNYLLAKRLEDPAKGEWYFPGGRIFKWETWKDTALRKGHEELGVKLDIGELISAENFFDVDHCYHTLNLIVHAKFVYGIIKLDKSHEEYKWMDSIPDNLHPCVKNPLLKFGFK